MTKRKGRPPKPGPREPNGRASRKAVDIEAIAFTEGPMQTVLQARRRHMGVTITGPVTREQATVHKLAQRGSILGSLWADGKITDQELAAGNQFCENFLRYASLNGIPTPTPTAASYGAVKGGSRPDRLRAARIAKAVHEADMDVLRHCEAGTSWAIRRACVEDLPAPVANVRLGLFALVKAGRA